MVHTSTWKSVGTRQLVIGRHHSPHCHCPVSLVILSLLWLMLMFFLCRSQSSPQIPSKGSYETKFDHVTSLLKTSQQLPIALKINFTFLNLAYRSCMIWPGTHLPYLHLKSLPAGCSSSSLSFKSPLNILQKGRLSPPKSESSPTSLVHKTCHWTYREYLYAACYRL